MMILMMIIIVIMIIMIKIILIIVVVIINILFQPGDFSNGSTTEYHLVDMKYLTWNAGSFPATFVKITTVTGIFEGFYLDFKQFSIVCNTSRRLSNARYRKF